jgi:predicted ATP-grasp superfamily ATP-dependent carboligase
VKVLVTSARFPFALELVRKLGASGNAVVAADTFSWAPGLHSRFAAVHVVTPPAAHDPAAYVEAIDAIAVAHEVELIVPSFEEGFYLARLRDRLAGPARLLAADFETLAQLHSKAAFAQLCRQEGLPVPATRVAADAAQLRDAVAETARYFARPSFSRSGVRLLTNVGPRAGRLRVDDCAPTETNPWIVQEYVEGTDVCSYTVAHEGRVVLHVAYEIPAKLDDASGVQFISIEASETLELAQRVVARTGYTGQISFDYRRTGAGLVFIECNPRATSGVSLTTDEALARAICHPDTVQAPQLVARGRHMQVDLGIVNDVFARKLPPLRGLHDLLSIRDIYLDKHDIVPALYGLVALRHERADARLPQATRAHVDRALTDEVHWNGEPIQVAG